MLFWSRYNVPRHVTCRKKHYYLWLNVVLLIVQKTFLSPDPPVGKSFLACAIGRQACSLGYKSSYLGMNRFLEKVTQSKLDGTYIKFLSQIEKTQLLIIDDWGLYPLDINSRLALLQVLEDRYAKRSTIITSQLPVAAWYDYINEPTLADYPHFFIMRSNIMACVVNHQLS